jgi:hypothetical protein
MYATAWSTTMHATACMLQCMLQLVCYSLYATACMLQCMLQLVCYNVCYNVCYSLYATMYATAWSTTQAPLASNEPSSSGKDSLAYQHRYIDEVEEHKEHSSIRTRWHYIRYISMYRYVSIEQMFWCIAYCAWSACSYPGNTKAPKC